METYRSMSPLMQDLIDRCIENALEMVLDMDGDLDKNEILARTFGQYLDVVKANARQMFEVELDPAACSVRCPDSIGAAIDERVMESLEFDSTFNVRKK